jgi:ribosomal protein L18
VQIVVSDVAQDKILFGTSSKILLTKGLSDAKSGTLKNRFAAYLTGFLVGKKMKEKVKEAIVDIGMHRNIQKSRVYAAVKGAKDAGLVVACSETALPEEKEIARTAEMQKLLADIKKKI